MVDLSNAPLNEPPDKTPPARGIVSNPPPASGAPLDLQAVSSTTLPTTTSPNPNQLLAGDVIPSPTQTAASAAANQSADASPTSTEASSQIADATNVSASVVPPTVFLSGAAKSTSHASAILTVSSAITRPTAKGDEPTIHDRLGRMRLVRALAAVLSDPSQDTPLTIGLFGEWGEGKTSIMKMLQKELSVNGSSKPGFSFAWFNAWEYEHTNNMAAGLAQEIVASLGEQFNPELPRLCSRALELPPLKYSAGWIKRNISDRWPWLRSSCSRIRTQWRRLRLGLRFASEERGWELVKALLSLCSLLGAILFGAIAFSATPNEYLKALLGTGAVVGFGAFYVVFSENLRKIVEHPSMSELKTYVRLPSYGDHLGLLPVIKSHIRALCKICLPSPNRLVVFVDDLDRCGPRAIMDTFDAIRLVMDVPGVVVVIGIDHRVALRTIGDQYKAHADGDRTAEMIARDFLGKIVQLPIRVYKPTGPDFDSFLVSLMSTADAADQEPAKMDTDTDFKAVMEHSEQERNEFARLAKLARMTNPRQLIRMRNSFRLLKALDAIHGPWQSNFPPEKLLRMLFWQEYIRSRPPDSTKEFQLALGRNERSDETDSLMQEDGLFQAIYQDFPVGGSEEAAARVEMVLLPSSREPTS